LSLFGESQIWPIESHANNQFREMTDTSKTRINGLLELLYSPPVVIIEIGVIALTFQLIIPSTYLFSIEMAGVLMALYAAIEAARASKRSKSTQDELVKVALLARESRSNFKAAFEDHLVKNLQKHKHIPADVYLLLSTPAYGFAVVGKELFERFRVAIEDLDQDCKLQVIFFSPDAHFHYWCNVLLWWITRGNPYAIEFGHAIEKVIGSLSHKNFKLWLSRETTVRLFGFIHNAEEPKAYLLLVDRFSIPQDQLGRGFKSRSIPILTTQVGEFIGASDLENYFNRIKQCPYTFRDQADAVLEPVVKSAHGDLLKHLMWDYLLGRTLQKQFDNFKFFSSEMRVFLVNVRNDESWAILKGLSDEDLVERLISKLVTYYADICQRQEFSSYKTEKQLRRIKFSTDKIKELGLEIANTQELNRLGKLSSAKSIDPDKLWNSQSDRFEKLLYCLYVLLTSGFGESQYAKTVSRSAWKSDSTLGSVSEVKDETNESHRAHEIA
jgi:hypothetical protein